MSDTIVGTFFVPISRKAITVWTAIAITSVVVFAVSVISAFVGIWAAFGNGGGRTGVLVGFGAAVVFFGAAVVFAILMIVGLVMVVSLHANNRRALQAAVTQQGLSTTELPRLYAGHRVVSHTGHWLHAVRVRDGAGDRLQVSVLQQAPNGQATYGQAPSR